MHYDILVEDESGKYFLDIIVPKIISKDDSYVIKSYKGIGRITKGYKSSKNIGSRVLLNMLPGILNGYGKTYSAYKGTYTAKVIVVCDLDNKTQISFRKELDNVLQSCHHKPDTAFCIAVEELEAWLLGDVRAIKDAFPKAKMHIIEKYQNDSICGTWEVLAEAIYKGGVEALKKANYYDIGGEKIKWAKKIAPLMDVDNNKSPSFNNFVNTVRSA